MLSMLIALLWAAQVYSQPSFSVQLEPILIPGAPGLQAFAAGEWEGEWLVMAGRTDGLHQRQPFAAFDEANQNQLVYVLNPTTQQVWSAAVSTLPVSIAEQLLATNLEFIQRDSMLYLIGGYGYSPTALDHITHPQLLAVQVPGLIAAIKSGNAITPYFRALADDRMAVTGGYLALLEEEFYLVGGQRFDGRYNPMNHPTFTQTYTDAIRIFGIEDDGAQLNITDYRAWTDTDHLHRRDYNLTPQIFPDGRPGLTIFSGVFQHVEDRPWLYPVDIDTGGYYPRTNFSQYLNHYHCAHMALYSAADNQQHTVFFGGMAEYTLDASGNLVQDINVPFVNTIARVTRYADGSLEEVKLPAEMPELLGSSAEFFRHPDVPAYPNGVIRMDEVYVDSVLIGYIFGGIRSTQANIFFTNIPSEAIPTVYRVWLTRSTTAAPELPVYNPLAMSVSPNPTTGDMLINYRLPKAAPVRFRLYSASGKLLGEFDEGQQPAGPHFLKLQASGMPKGYLMVNMVADSTQVTQKVILE